jgi:glucose/arabinose dehydrogenase
LALGHPPSHGDQNKSEWIQHPGHLVNLSSPRSQDLAIQLDQVFGPYDIGQGPDGLLYLLTDEADGALLRIDPAK